MGKAAEEIADEVREVDRALDAAAREVEHAVGEAGPALDRSAEKAVALTKGALNAGVSELTTWGRMVERAWKFLERMSNPPWTPDKLLFWAIAVLAVAVAAVFNHEFHSGVLGLPVLEKGGSDFIAAMASLGPGGLLAFTAISTLFFMFIPTEPFFFVMLGTSQPVPVLIVAAAVGSTIGSCANYGFGTRFRHRSIAKRGDSAKLGKWGKRAHSSWGTVLLFVAASLPLPELVAVAYGIADYPFKKFLAVTLGARFVKWTWVAAVFLLFKTTF